MCNKLVHSIHILILYPSPFFITLRLPLSWSTQLLHQSRTQCQGTRLQIFQETPHGIHEGPAENLGVLLPCVPVSRQLREGADCQSDWHRRVQDPGVVSEQESQVPQTWEANGASEVTSRTDSCDLPLHSLPSLNDASLLDRCCCSEWEQATW